MTPSKLSKSLRIVADRIDQSSRPSRSAVAAELRRIIATMGGYSVYLTDDYEMGEPQGTPSSLDVADISVYLHEDPRHSVIFVGDDGRMTALWHQGEDPTEDTYYYQVLPLDEPNASEVSGPDFLHKLSNLGVI